MDPITQGALGAAVVQGVLGTRAGKRTWLMGALSGMAPDLDVLIRSSDPLVGITYHRHFTHSAAFVPVGGLLCALPFLWLDRNRAGAEQRRKWIVLACILGLATHAPLDCGTSYGTLFFWPFSDIRVALDFLPIIDLLYTLPLLVGVVLAVRRTDQRWVHLGLVVAHLYAGHCLVQRERADAARRVLVQERGQTADRGRALPFLLNNAMWRTLSVVQTPGGPVLQTDMVVVPWFGDPSVIDGPQVPLLTAPVPPGWPDDERSTEAVRVLRWFSGGYVGMVANPDGGRAFLCDLRLSMAVAETRPVVCVGRDQHGLFPARFTRDASVRKLWQSLVERDPRQRPVASP